MSSVMCDAEHDEMARASTAALRVQSSQSRDTEIPGPKRRLSL